MVKITQELLRKRSEHNEGCLTTLESITLHQFEIEKIELVGEHCRNLKIIFLQHNLIEKIENLSYLKKLQYLNLSINSIRKIENLEKNESLVRLDLTLNYIDDLLSIKNLFVNYNLRELHMVGNPCCSYKGYKSFIIGSLPFLEKLDGIQITKSDRILANQEVEEIEKYLNKNQQKWINKNNEDMLKSAKNPQYNKKGERVYGNDPLSRKMAAKELADKRKEKGYIPEKRHEIDASKIGEISRLGKKSKMKRLEPKEEIEKYGRVMQKNEGKWRFKFRDKGDHYILDVPAGKYCLTSDIKIDVQTTYVIVDVRKKRLCLRFEENVSPDKTTAQRSRVTGNLKLSIPKAKEILKNKDE